MLELSELTYTVFINVLIPIITIVIGYYTTKSIKKFETKTSMQLNIETETFINNKAENAIQYVGELAAQHLKKKMKMSSNEKLIHGINFLMENINIEIPKKLTKKEATQYIESALARTKGEGATKDNVIK